MNQVRSTASNQRNISAIPLAGARMELHCSKRPRPNLPRRLNNSFSFQRDFHFISVLHNREGYASRMPSLCLRLEPTLAIGYDEETIFHQLRLALPAENTCPPFRPRYARSKSCSHGFSPSFHSTSRPSIHGRDRTRTHMQRTADVHPPRHDPQT